MHRGKLTIWELFVERCSILLSELDSYSASVLELEAWLSRVLLVFNYRLESTAYLRR